jgi:hypothetical protein
MWSKQFWKAAAERVIATAAEALLALLLVDGFGVADLAGSATWSVVGIAALASLLKSVIAAGKDGNPSIGSIEKVTPKVDISR